MPRVTVVIPTYNRSTLLAKAIASVQAQTYRDFEIVVVDDGSTDDTAEVVSGFDDVQYLKVPNGGLGAARNAGTRHGTGDLIAYLDDDDLWRPQKLERQVPLFDDPEVALVHSGGQAFNPDGWRSEPGSGFYGADLDFHGLLAHRVATIQTVVVRRSVFEAVGGFWPHRAAEDWDFLLRVAAKHKMQGVPEDLVDVLVGNAGLSSKAALMWRCQNLALTHAGRLHDDCSECAVIVPATRRLLRGYVFRGEKDRSTRLRAEGRWLAAGAARLNGYRYDPKAAATLPLRLLRSR